MIWQCVDDSQLHDAVATMAATLATGPTRALVATRMAMRDGFQREFAEQLNAERDAQRELGWTLDHAEGLAAFRARRAPRFTGQ
jgi:2-(1,2-epoxy-1,2-dihydrophenyl)acetyl-CoA isomerase